MFRYYLQVWRVLLVSIALSVHVCGIVLSYDCLTWSVSLSFELLEALRYELSELNSLEVLRTRAYQHALSAFLSLPLRSWRCVFSTRSPNVLIKRNLLLCIAIWALWTFKERVQVTSQKKNSNFATSKVKKKKFQFNHWPFISWYMCPGTPSFDLPTPNFAGSSNLNSVPGSGPGTES